MKNCKPASKRLEQAWGSSLVKRNPYLLQTDDSCRPELSLGGWDIHGRCWMESEKVSHKSDFGRTDLQVWKVCDNWFGKRQWVFRAFKISFHLESIQNFPHKRFPTSSFLSSKFAVPIDSDGFWHLEMYERPNIECIPNQFNHLPRRFRATESGKTEAQFKLRKINKILSSKAFLAIALCG